MEPLCAMDHAGFVFRARQQKGADDDREGWIDKHQIENPVAKYYRLTRKPMDRFEKAADLFATN